MFFETGISIPGASPCAAGNIEDDTLGKHQVLAVAEIITRNLDVEVTSLKEKEAFELCGWKVSELY